jgi:circadian clock protein KaiC
MRIRTMRAVQKLGNDNRSLPKAPTGIQGLDEVTRGGFPRGRPTLICGSAGAGKTLLAMEFLIRGATEYNEPGVFMAFEETAPELTQNVRSLGFDLDELAKEKKLAIDFVRLERSEIDETGDYDLEGLFIRLGAAIDAIRAKRVVLDTIENLFAGLQNEGILRAELRRLFRWLKDRGITAVITAERGDGALTRHGLERICFRLRAPARPPGDRPGFHTPSACRQISGNSSWHQRIPLSDRRRRFQRLACDIFGPRSRGK